MKCPGKKRVGITLRYSLDEYLRQPPGVADTNVLRAARKAVPRLRRVSFDTSAGPFCAAHGAVQKCGDAKRDIEIDFWGGSRAPQCGLTQSEAARVKKAYRGTGVEVVAKGMCCVRGSPWYPPRHQ